MNRFWLATTEKDYLNKGIFGVENRRKNNQITGNDGSCQLFYLFLFILLSELKSGN